MFFPMEYVEMCKNNDKLNEWWIPAIGDVCIMDDEIVVIDNDFARLHISDHLDEYTWIPRLNQLYSIVEQVHETDWYGARNVVEEFVNILRMYFVDSEILRRRMICQEALVLSSIMDVVYKKSWDGAKWDGDCWQEKLKYKGDWNRGVMIG